MKLIIVDDEVEIIKALRRQISIDNLEIFSFVDSSKAKEALTLNEFDVLLTDQRMPGLTGLDLIRFCREQKLKIVPILITGYTDFSIVVDAINIGEIFRYLPKPWKGEELHKVINDALTKKRLMHEEEEIISQYLIEKQQWLDASKALAIDLEDQKNNIFNGYLRIIEVKDHDLFVHSKNVAELASQFAKYLGFDEVDVQLVFDAAMVHDIGKIAIRDAIIYKRGLLDEDEYVEIKKHAEVGGEILRAVNGFEDIAKIVEQHHERYDGLGYPNGLKGDEIKLSAQIIGLADVYDALLNQRVYKSSFIHNKVIEMIQTHKAGYFEQNLVEMFFAFLDHKLAND